ncbi:hypothetical protein Hanom_Chr05g00391561 [Helianthus anomalus]
MFVLGDMGNGGLQNVRPCVSWLLEKDNLADSVSILTQGPLDKFVREYRILLDLHPILSSKNKTIYPFRQGKFPLYTRVCNFANYRVPFRGFSLGFFYFSGFTSARAQNQRPNLDVFRYFYEFITAGDWYTFAHRKGIPSPSGDERSSLKNWKDIFFWLDDRCLPTEMAWRFKDQTMSFELGEDFAFNKELARALIEHKSPIRNEMSLKDAMRIPNFNVLDFDFDEQAEGKVSFMHQVASAAQEIRPLTGAAGSSGSQVGKESILDRVDDDSEVRSLDDALKYRPSSGSLKSKGIASDVEPKGLIRKRKNEAIQIRSSDPLPMPSMKKNKKRSSYSSGNVITELDEHLSGGKSSREEVALARSASNPAFFGGYRPVNESENMEIEDQGVTSKGNEKVQSEPKMVTFSGTILDSSLGPDCFIDDEGDQVTSLPPSWF